MLSISIIVSWIKPSFKKDAYKVGDIVQHNGLIWQSMLDSNIWEPGVYGWWTSPYFI